MGAIWWSPASSRRPFRPTRLNRRVHSGSQAGTLAEGARTGSRSWIPNNCDPDPELEKGKTMSSVPAARSAPIIPLAERLYRPLEPYAYTLIRIATGAIFVPHGVLKLFFGGATTGMGYALGVLELVGGLAIALGVLTRPFALALIVDGRMIIADGAARIAAGNVLKTGFYPPLFWAWVVALLEFVGMILLALGLGTRVVAFMMAIELGVIVVTIQMPNGYFWTSRGTEFALLLCLVCLAFVFGGGGRYSLDRKVGREF